MLRLFAAIPVPDEIGMPLQPLQKNLSGASWRPLENFHITLAFYGDVSVTTAEELDEALAAIPARQFELELAGMGWFGRREPRSVWARVRENEDLNTLAGLCTRAAKRLGLRMEKRSYTPHLTLAYCHGTPLSDAEAFVSRNAGYESRPFWVDRFHLYSSHFGKGASRYIAETEYPLG
ncbi:MAG: RNA 2',3'-cyclic phosphodiesterase [Pseudomonadota bacterium]